MKTRSWKILKTLLQLNIESKLNIECMCIFCACALHMGMHTHTRAHAHTHTHTHTQESSKQTWNFTLSLTLASNQLLLWHMQKGNLFTKIFADKLLQQKIPHNYSCIIHCIKWWIDNASIMQMVSGVCLRTKWCQWMYASDAFFFKQLLCLKTPFEQGHVPLYIWTIEYMNQCQGHSCFVCPKLTSQTNRPRCNVSVFDFLFQRSSAVVDQF